MQGNGNGLFNLFISGGTEFLDDWHYVTAAGFQMPVDTFDESTMGYWSNHIDRKLGDSGLYLFGEANWYHWYASGNAFTLAPVEGGDLFNLGAAGVSGNDIVTGALGLKYKPVNNMELGLAWELPLTDRRDVLHDRITFDCIIRY